MMVAVCISCGSCYGLMVLVSLGIVRLVEVGV